MGEEMVKKDEVVEIEGIKVKREQVDLIKKTIFIGATDDELRLFFYECARRGTHPMDRLIFPVARKDKDGNRRVSFQTGIDYLRAAAEETTRYVGQKSVEYGPEIIQTIDGGEIKVPTWAEVTVLRKDPETGEINEIPSKVFWKEFYPGERLGHMWRKMPNLMLAKCAEAGALRKGFPRKLGGLYINEEMEQAEAVPFGTKERPALQEPKKKENGEKKTSTTDYLTNRISIEDVKEQTKTKDDKPMKSPLYHILSDAGVDYRTFDKTLATMASKEAGTGMLFDAEYKETQYGVDLKTLVMVEKAPENKGELPL